MNKLLLILVLTQLTITSCSTAECPNEIKQHSESLPEPDIKFDSCMKSEIGRWKELIPKPVGDFHEAYLVKRRFYNSSFLGLTFDERVYSAQSHASRTALYHIYNDSIQFVLPFMTKNYSEEEPPNAQDAASRPVLTEKLNSLRELIGEKEDLDLFFKEILRFYGCNRINSDFSYSILEQQLRYFQQNGSYPEICKDEIDKALLKIKSGYKDGAKYIYSNGAIVFVFTLKQDMIVNSEILLTGCSYFD